MIGSNERLGVRRGEVAAKVIDGEAILINLTTGLYYSMGKVGGRVWSLIEQNRDCQDIASTIAAEYDVSPGAAASDVAELVAKLAAERLIDAASGVSAPREAQQLADGTAKSAYVKPELRKFGDMAEIFALDPPLPSLAKEAK